MHVAAADSGSYEEHVINGGTRGKLQLPPFEFSPLI